MVGMTRAHIADPHIARKIIADREDDIRPCVGAGYCIDRIYFGGEALCIHNPATGREATMPHHVAPATGKRHKIVVVGAAPAGLEAARVPAAPAHHVLPFTATAAGSRSRTRTESLLRRWAAPITRLISRFWPRIASPSVSIFA